MVDYQARSKALFGNKYAVDLILAIADSAHNAVVLAQFARDLGCSQKSLGELVRRFTAAGLLRTLPPAEQSKPVTMIEGPLWDRTVELARECRGDVSASTKK